MAQFGGYWLILLVFNYGCEAVGPFGIVLNLNSYDFTGFRALFILNSKGIYSNEASFLFYHLCWFERRTRLIFSKFFFLEDCI